MRREEHHEAKTCGFALSFSCGGNGCDGRGNAARPLIGQNTEMNRSAAEYDDLRVQLKSEEPAQATDAPEKANGSALRRMLDAAGFPSATQAPLELPAQDESPPEIDIGTGADLAACLAQNDDFIAWIRIPGTNVDYPVVWTDDAEHYLHHTFTGKQGAAGTLFSLMKTDYSIPSRNIAIYGHHLKSTGEKMFTSLVRYQGCGFLCRTRNRAARYAV